MEGGGAKQSAPTKYFALSTPCLHAPPPLHPLTNANLFCSNWLGFDTSLFIVFVYEYYFPMLPLRALDFIEEAVVHADKELIMYKGMDAWTNLALTTYMVDLLINSLPTQTKHKIIALTSKRKTSCHMHNRRGHEFLGHWKSTWI